MSDVEKPPQISPIRTRLEHAADGVIYFHGGEISAPPFETMGQVLERQAERSPRRVFLAERQGSGWRELTYREAWIATGRLAKGLLDLGCSPERPLLVLSDNSIENALFSLAAMRIGAPVAPVSASYAAADTLSRLRYAVELSKAAVAYLGPRIPAAVRGALETWGVAIADGARMASLPNAALDVRLAAERIGPDSPAKLMFTSGSTGTPKAVINTHGMLWINQVQLASVLPPAGDRAPVLVDWLPWSHTFGGNFVFNMALWHGGVLHIDDGRPTPASVGKTLKAMAEIGPTRHFNVPAGLLALLPLLEQDRDAARQALSRLEFVFCAAAALPQAAFDRWTALLKNVCGRDVPLIAGWGATETAPCATLVDSPDAPSTNIGSPVPGVILKMVPESGRFELRVKGPNVTPGYWGAKEATEAAFDEEGFYRTGDAGKFMDPESPQSGIMFDGRIAENFKLATGTWVNVGRLRLALIDAAQPYVRDVVVTGHDREEIGALLFLDEERIRAEFGIAAGQPLAQNVALNEVLRRAIADYNLAHGAGGSTRVRRFGIEERPPSLALGELTDKGYINQRAVRDNRGEAIARLYRDDAATL